MANELTAKPMYFSTLIVENIKCFGTTQSLDLRGKNGKISHWTLILGENGVGKTTLLKCLSWMFPVESPIEEKEDTQKNKGKKRSKEVDLKPYMDDFDNEKVYDQLIRFGENIDAKITAKLVDGLLLDETCANDSVIEIAMTFARENGELETITPYKFRVKEYNSPSVFAYNASRHLAFKNIESMELKDPIGNLFSESGDLYDTEQLLSMLDSSARRQGKKSKAAGLLNKVKQILVDLLPDVKDVNDIIINSPIREDGSVNTDLVELKTDDGHVKLLELSLGYKTMLSWIVDLAVRMLWRFPESEKPLNEPAVVIIDEIDLHLHPIWQLTVREKLTTAFPNTQFICTAHSPFMAQASIHENLCVVNRKNGQVCIENDPFIVESWRIGQIATSELFNMPSERSPEVQKLIEERRALLDKNRLTAIEAGRLKELDDKISELPVLANTDDDNILEQIRKSVHLLKERGIIND